MAELIGTIVGMVLSIALPLVIQRSWVKRLPPERRARMWNVATWGSALYAFGAFSMLGFVWITRASAPHRDVRRAVILVASLFALGMLDVVLFTATTSKTQGPSTIAITFGVITCVFPAAFAALTAKKGDRARDAGAIGLGLVASVLVSGLVIGTSYLVVLAYELAFAVA